MLQYYVSEKYFKSAQPICFFSCLNIEKTAKNHYFFAKIDFLSPNSVQSPSNFQIFTFPTQDINVLLQFQELHHFSEK